MVEIGGGTDSKRCFFSIGFVFIWTVSRVSIKSLLFRLLAPGNLYQPRDVCCFWEYWIGGNTTLRLFGKEQGSSEKRVVEWLASSEIDSASKLNWERLGLRVIQAGEMLFFKGDFDDVRLMVAGWPLGFKQWRISVLQRLFKVLLVGDFSEGNFVRSLRVGRIKSLLSFGVGDQLGVRICLNFSFSNYYCISRH